MLCMCCHAVPCCAAPAVPAYPWHSQPHNHLACRSPPCLRSGPLADLIIASAAANRTVVLPLSGTSASAADAGNLTTAILDCLGSRDALSDPAPTVTVLPLAGGGVEVSVTFPPGASGTAGALTLLVDAQQAAPGLVTALSTGAGGSVTVGTADATTQEPSG